MQPSLPTWLFLTAVALGCLLGLGALLSGDVSGLADGLSPDAPELDADDGAEGGGEPHASGLSDGWLSLLGVGRVPLGLLLSLDLLLFGGTGIVAGEVLGALLSPSSSAVAALALAFVVGPALGGRLARLVARYLPGVESHGATRASLVGRFARAELPIDARFGRARVVDAGGAAHWVRCVSSSGVIEAGAELVLLSHDPKTGAYEAERADRFLSRPSTNQETP